MPVTAINFQNNSMPIHGFVVTIDPVFSYLFLATIAYMLDVYPRWVDQIFDSLHCLNEVFLVRSIAMGWNDSCSFRSKEFRSEYQVASGRYSNAILERVDANVRIVWWRHFHDSALNFKQHRLRMSTSERQYFKSSCWKWNGSFLCLLCHSRKHFLSLASSVFIAPGL